MKQYIYVITSVVLDKESMLRWKIKDFRTFGCYDTLDQAILAVANNYGDMQECLYNYLVIEKTVRNAIHPCIDDSFWYKWDDDQGWITVRNPMPSTTSFGIG